MKMIQMIQTIQMKVTHCTMRQDEVRELQRFHPLPSPAQSLCRHTVRAELPAQARHALAAVF
jgi:hypothetical protein